MGSKSRIAKFILPFIEGFNDNKRIYIEPFVGGANMIDKVNFDMRVGYDKNPYLIALLRHVSKGGRLPSTISEKSYYRVRDNIESYPKSLVGAVGFCASYGGRFFEGYPRGSKPDATPRDYTNEALRNLEAQRKNIVGVQFKHSDYANLDFRQCKALLYCDPPYAGSKPYKISLLGKFDSDNFWHWARQQSTVNPVLVSEYKAPKDFVCLKKFDLKSNLRVTGVTHHVESLFLHESRM
jgi:DNA adenine methylase